MRIWFISPQYYDKKGILAQWNEGNILKNIIVEKKKTGGWVNHPFSRRVLRYKKKSRRKIINTYLNYLRDYGVEHHNIKFKEKYLEKDYVDETLQVPLLAEHLESDFNDALTKMKVRDNELYKQLKKLKKEDNFISNLVVQRPYYLENDIEKYKTTLSKGYIDYCKENNERICGKEIPVELADKWDKIRGSDQTKY